MTAIIMVCAIVILIEAVRRWYAVLVKKEIIKEGKTVSLKESGYIQSEYGCN
jgi:hypothetical protein